MYYQCVFEYQKLLRYFIALDDYSVFDASDLFSLNNGVKIRTQQFTQLDVRKKNDHEFIVCLHGAVEKLLHVYGIIAASTSVQKAFWKFLNNHNTNFTFELNRKHCAFFKMPQHVFSVIAEPEKPRWYSHFFA